MAEGYHEGEIHTTDLAAHPDGSVHLTPARACCAGKEEYLDLNGHLIELLTDDIASRQSLPHSIMPPGLLLAFTQQELRDLLAFLRLPPPGDVLGNKNFGID
jgi:hypothetical protein